MYKLNIEIKELWLVERLLRGWMATYNFNNNLKNDLFLFKRWLLFIKS